MDGRFTCTDMRIFDGQQTASSMLRAGSISPESSRMDGRFTCTDMRIFDGQRTASSMLRAGSISPESSRMDGIKNASASDVKAF